MQIIEGFRLITNFLKAKVGERSIVSQSIISYLQDFPLQDLDLVTKKYVDDIFESLDNPEKKSLIQISGNTIIDWQSVANDSEGNPNPEGQTYEDWFGDFPGTVSCWVEDGSGSRVLLPLPVVRLANGDLNIDASNLTNVIVIII